MNAGNGSISGFNFSQTARNTNRIIHENSLYVGHKLTDNQFALGTHIGGLFIINKKGEIVAHVNESLGLQNETISNIYYNDEKSGLLWLTLANGISCVNISSPVRQFANESGLNGPFMA
jgi:AraC family transcriptional regulator, chitin signaling transcriptional activator